MSNSGLSSRSPCDGTTSKCEVIVSDWSSCDGVRCPIWVCIGGKTFTWSMFEHKSVILGINKVLAKILCLFKMLLGWVGRELCQLSHCKCYIRMCTNHQIQQQANYALVVPKQFWWCLVLSNLWDPVWWERCGHLALVMLKHSNTLSRYACWSRWISFPFHVICMHENSLTSPKSQHSHLSIKSFFFSLMCTLFLLKNMALST